MSSLLSSSPFTGELWDTPPKNTDSKQIHKLAAATAEIGEPAIAALNDRLDKYPEELEAVDYTGWTPLLWAARYATPEVVQLLVNKGANIDYQDSYGNTALILTVRHPKKIDNCKVLLEAGADLTIKDNSKNDAFFYARDKPEILDLLNNPYQIPDHIRYNIDKINDPEYYMNITL